MQTLIKSSFKKIILALSLALFISVNVDAASVYDLPQIEHASISFIDNHIFSVYQEAKSVSQEVSMRDAKFKFTSKDYLFCTLLLGVYIMLVRRKTNSRNADF